MVGLDELETAVMGIVVQDQKQLAKLSTAMLTDSHENLRQSFIREVVRKRGDCVDEGERPSLSGPESGAGNSTSTSTSTR